MPLAHADAIDEQKQGDLKEAPAGRLAYADSRPSEAAQSIADMLGVLPTRTIEQLRDLLGHHLAVPSPSILRERRLGLVNQMVRDGELITQTRYEVERAEREKQGERWESAETLSRAFGGWLRVLTATIRHYHGDGRAPNEVGHLKVKNRRAISKAEALHALCSAERFMGLTPTRWEYQEWSQLNRKAARLRGGYDGQMDSRDPRLPTLSRINQLFGSFDAAMAQVSDVATTEGGS